MYLYYSILNLSFKTAPKLTMFSWAAWLRIFNPDEISAGCWLRFLPWNIAPNARPPRLQQPPSRRSLSTCHLCFLVVLVLEISIDIMNFQRLDHVKLSSYCIVYDGEFSIVIAFFIPFFVDEIDEIPGIPCLQMPPPARGVPTQRLAFWLGQASKTRPASPGVQGNQVCLTWKISRKDKVG